MIKSLWLLVLGLVLLGIGRERSEETASSFFVADSLLTDIHAIYDSAGLVDGYRAVVNTPVCEDSRCYVIELEIYWDVIGAFVAFDTIPGMALTKLDHVPFTSEDYQKLNTILSNPQSSLGQYEKEELVEKSRSSILDGITGATRSEIQNNVINGAVYSCHTLWHITHGSVKDSIRFATSRAFSKNLIKKLVRQQDQEINYYLIQYFSDHEFIEYLPEVVDCLKAGKGYFVKKAVEQMPASALIEPISQAYFSEYFDQLDYFAQVALLKKLQNSALSQDFKAVLEENLSDRNSYRDELIQSILN